MVLNRQILSDLRLMRDNAQPVELMNIYKGVPFVCKGNILDIEENRVFIHVNSPEIVLLANERNTKLLGNDYFEPTSAQVEAVDVVNGVVTLCQFSYLGAKLGDRMMVRVTPPERIPSLIETEDRPILGELVDISMNGMGIRVSVDHYLPILKPGAAVFLSTTLPNGEVSVQGTIMSAIKSAGDYRLAVRFTAHDEYKAIIYHYLVDRRAEIEAELRQEFDRARREAPQA